MNHANKENFDGEKTISNSKKLQNENNDQAEELKTSKIESNKDKKIDKKNEKREENRKFEMLEKYNPKSFEKVSREKLEKWNKEGAWKPYEHLEYESAFFSFLPNCFFKLRNLISRPFTFHLFKCCQLSVGEILLIFLEIALVASLGSVLILSDLENRGEAMGELSSILLGISFASSGKNLLPHLLLGMPWERQVMFHKFNAFAAIACGAAHGIIEGLGRHNSLSGLILASSMVAIIIFSFVYLRRYCYSLFYIMHLLIVVVIIVYSIFHEATGGLIGAGVWIFDILVRVILIARFAFKTQKTELFAMPGGIVRVEVTPKRGKKFYFRGGQYVFICIPKAQIWEFHPISVSNCSFDEKIVLHFKKVGPWTKKVCRLVEKQGTPAFAENELELLDKASKDAPPGMDKKGSTKLETRVIINGPYGAPQVDIDSPRYKLVILVAGGIGITPMQSIYNELLIQHLRGRPLVKVKLIWCLRDVGMLDTVAGHPDNFYNKEDIHPSQIESLKNFNSQNLEFSKVMEPNFFITRNGTEEIKENLEQKYNAIVHLGRPKMEDQFEEMAQLAIKNEVHDIAVLSCGPSTLISNAFKKSYEGTKKYDLPTGKKFKVNFDFHSEVFEF